MKQVPSIKRDIQQLDQRVIPTSHENKRDKIDGCHSSSSFANRREKLLFRAGEGKFMQAKICITPHHHEQQHGVKSGGEGAHVQRRRESVLAIVTLPEQRSIHNMPFHPGPEAMGTDKVSLGIIRETGKTSDMSRHANDGRPDENNGEDAASR
ncbi:hypothetical protein H113_07847 [Trichophyton rubrum MR1459]|uniref:Uncharacterized protein n=1 Tax=Trichophyton rubrum (strain ATCC MYA-4607 / CBS 118892) TaxID=559305 RepID=A0A080WJU6_TRIRC|nr:uncharacterized protein TERG_11555 [Trichophyton rubrum CBS 118892]EZF91131.1 hypothetical protein H113_07847 [Trichophyton rubrum MR1459]EZG02031.1 hypothetical protein H106_07625 [Trichophyton rubrum CBS 735.88]KFL60215.1 hypothetical protein TERG_11555 [Trichophyton rubrum CBS 118892]